MVDPSDNIQLDPTEARQRLQREFSGEEETKSRSVQLKEQGNLLYRERKYAAAINAYTEAIVSEIKV